MKRTLPLVKEIIITLFVASLVSSAVVIILSFILTNINHSDNAVTYVNAAGATIWGLFVGYKLCSLIDSRK